MPRELTQGEITTRELDRLISEIKDEKLKSQIRETISRLELHKSYGLRFERHLPEVITHEGKTIDLGEQYFPWLKKVEQVKGKNPKGPRHLLLECDNYIALKYLQYTHQGKVDVIYIDPPYNTGNKDFRYNDKFVDSEDNFRHSKWLSFMEKRLKLAKSLLSDKGVIFISIDDREQAGLKLLCDDIFGEARYVDTISWQKKNTVSNDIKLLGKQIEYILVYKNDQLEEFNTNSQKQSYIDKTYKNPDNDPRGAWMSVQMFREDGREEYMVRAPNGKTWIKPWVHSKNSMKSLIEAGAIYWGKEGNSCPRKKVFLKDTSKRGQRVPNLFAGKEYGYSTTSGIALKELFGRKTFDYPKPVELIKRIVSLVGESALILDFFAGSGTTYQAVAELNEEDGGNRQCILVTNNESNICREVTWERVKRVTTGTHDYPECTKKYDGNPSAHATFYTMEIYTDDEIDQQTRGWKKNMEGYLPLVSSKFNIAHNWKKIPDTKGYYCEETAILSTDELDYEAQSFLKKEAIDRLIIISEDKEEFELARKRCKKTTKVSEYHFLPRNYREYFANFHTKA